MTDILAKLKRLEIDGIVLPVLRRRTGFATEQARHKLQFRNNEVVEPLGSRNWTFEYTIPFRQDIAKGPYQDLFTNTLPLFLDMCERAALETVTLHDPVLGFYQVTCTSVQEETDNNKRDGTDVTAQFIWAPDPGTIVFPGDGLGALGTALSDAGVLDKELEVTFRSRQLPPPPSLTNPLEAISGLIKQVETRGNQIQARIIDFNDRVLAIEESVRDLREPKLAPTIRSLRNLRDATERVRNDITAPARIRTYETTSQSTIAELASRLSTPVQDLTILNPHIAVFLPDVPKGVPIRYIPDFI